MGQCSFHTAPPEPYMGTTQWKQCDRPATHRVTGLYQDLDGVNLIRSRYSVEACAVHAAAYRNPHYEQYEVEPL